MGRPFKTNCTLQINVWRLSSVNVQYFPIAFNMVLTDLTKDSHIPHIHRLAGVLKMHSIF